MNNEIKKNNEYIVDIIDNGYEGEGIAKINNFTIFVKDAIKGEKVKILILKVNSSFAFAKILEILISSEYRIESDCETYKRCGGCNLRHIKYEKTLEMKRNIVQNLTEKMLDTKIKVEKTIGMEYPFNYRNKAQYPVGLNKEGEAIFGVFANRTHKIIETKRCKIQTEISEEIARFIIQFIKEKNIKIYNEESFRGTLRHIIIRVGMKTNQVMCILVVNEKAIKDEDKLVQKLLKAFPNITTIVKNINNKNTNVILGNQNIVLYGNGYIEDKLGDFIFKISPMSFYQTNPIQTEKLYNIAIEKAELTKDDIVFDLYCGIGTIGIFASKYVKQIYGIEIVEDAIKDAKENAKLNNIDNAEFIVGDVEIALSELMEKRKITPDVVFVDPPRRGLDITTINNLIKIKAKRIVYISCNPATLVRDLKMLEEIYKIESITPVDMFPWTSHIENIAVLKLK